ncbi:MAG: hypothetical protein AAGI63_15130 [Planctomycetota bacterium]
MGRLPSWIPYRFREQWDVMRVASALRSLKASRSRVIPTADESDAELHMLICKRDVWPAMLAIKSLLQFSGLRLSLTLTDEGTLSTGDRQLFSDHFPGCRWLNRREEDVRSKLRSDHLQHLLRIYESDFSLSAKLLHPTLLSTHSRVIVLDPDTAFFERPDQLCDWVEESSVSLYTRDNNDSRDRDLPREIRHAFDEIGREALADPWRIEHYYFNSGFLAFEAAQCDLRIAETYLRWTAEKGQGIDCPNADIWFGHWTGEQASYLVMYAAMDPQPESFGPMYRLGSLGGVFTHFMRANLVKSSVLSTLSELCDDIE